MDKIYKDDLLKYIEYYKKICNYEDGYDNIKKLAYNIFLDTLNNFCSRDNEFFYIKDISDYFLHNIKYGIISGKYLDL